VEPPTDPDDVIVPPYLPDNSEAREELAGFYDEIRRKVSVKDTGLGTWIYLQFVPTRDHPAL